MERLDGMSVDQLWSLHQQVISGLIRKSAAEKNRLDARLRELGEPVRRHYPEVFPKYRNPAQPSETWSGRGTQPRWLTAQLSAGKQLEDFLIQSPRKEIAMQPKKRKGLPDRAPL